MGPRFSILVPTRQRPDTLLATLATLIWHRGDDYEIVVADNCGDEEVTAVVMAAQQRHPQVKHLRSDRILPMAVNWERGLAACSGEYVSVLGDDDGFLPSTLDVVRNLLAATDARVIAWETHAYWWPDTIAYWHKNRLYMPLGNNRCDWMDSRATLVATYRDPVAFGNLPMIYNGFVHREIINTVVNRFGGYFVPPEISPDVGSGIVNLAHTSRYLYCFRPLAIRGNSRRSTGTSFWARSLGKEQQQIFLKEEAKTAAQLMHHSMTSSQNIGFGIASTKLILKDLLFPHDKDLQIDLPATIRHVILSLNSDPEAYDDNLREALELANKIGYAVDPKTIPPKATSAPGRKPLQGLYGSGTNINIGINCDLANVFDVAGAARLAEAVSSPMTVEVKRPATAEETVKKAS
jgi:glycosyltransferase involved in cell wall biosynthesis